MKNLVIGFGSIMIMVLTIMTIAALNINSTNYLDLNTATRMAVYQTMEETLTENNVTMIRSKNADGTFMKDASGNYVYEELKVNSDVALKKLFNENLSMLLKGQNKVTVKILTADYEHGILSVNVSYNYQNMGFDRTIDVTQTVIRDSAYDSSFSNPEIPTEPDTPTEPEQPEIEATDYVYAYIDKNQELVISATDLSPSTDALYNGDSTYNFGKCTLDALQSWYPYRSLIKTARIDGIVKPTSCQSWFCNCKNLIEIKNLANLDTSACKNMKRMFSGCNTLTSIDLSNFNTSNVTTMDNMFTSCTTLTNLDLSNFNTSNVTTMGQMFNYCSGLTSLDVSNFDTSKVTAMNAMFYGCSGLTSLDLSNFDTSNVTNVNKMFYSCTNLKSITTNQSTKDKIISFGDSQVSSTVVWKDKNGSSLK